MSTSPGLVSLTKRRFATPRSAAAIIVLLTLLASFLIAAAPRLLTHTLHDEIAFQIDQLSDTTRDLSATSAGAPPSFGAATDESLTAGWGEGAGAVFGGVAQKLFDNREAASAEVQALTDHGAFAVVTEPLNAVRDPQNPADPRLLLQAVGDPTVREHLTLVSGAWPVAWHEDVWDSGVGEIAEDGLVTPASLVFQHPIEVVVASEVASDLEWQLGQDLVVSSTTYDGRNLELRFRLAGIAEPIDAAAARWLHINTPVLDAAYFFDGNSKPSYTAGVFVDAGSWGSIGPVTSLVRVNDPSVFGFRGVRTDLHAWYPVSAAAATAQDPETLLAGLRAFTGQAVSLGTPETGDARARFESQVTTVLDTSIRRANATTMTLAVAAVGPIAVSIALIVLAAGLIIRRRRPDLQLLSARGTTLARLRRLLAYEGLTLGVLPAIAGTTLALVLTPGRGGVWWTITALLVGLIPAAALAFSLTPRTLEPGRADLGVTGHSRWARLGELLVIVVAVIAVAVLLYRGINRDSTVVDPLVIAAPLLATVALGLLAVRMHPLWLSGVLHRAQKRTKLVPLVGAARSLRDPAAGTTAVLAMLVAVAIAVFSSLILATVDKGAVTAAERQVGGDISLSGPVFDADTIDQIAAFDGVADVAGLYQAGREIVQLGSERIPTDLFVTDTNALQAVQRGFTEGFPAGIVTPGGQPAQIVVSSEVAAQTGVGVASDLLGGVRIVGELPVLAGNRAGSAFAVIDTADFTEQTGRGFFPRQVLIRLVPGADVDSVITELRDTVAGTYVVQSLQESTRAIGASPAVTALRVALLGAVVLSVVLSIIAILLVSGVSRDARSRVVALLRTMGMSKASGRRIVAWESVPLGISSLVGGLVLGIVLPLLVLNSIDLRSFTGGKVQPGLTIDPMLTIGLVLAVVVALAIAVVGGVLSARTTSLVTVLRTEEGQ